MKKLILSSLLLLTSVASNAMEIKISNIEQIGHVDGYSESGKLVGRDVFNANILLKEKRLSFPILYVVENKTKLDYVVIFSTDDKESQNEANIMETKLFFKKNNISYEFVRDAVSNQLIKNLSLSN